MKNRKGAPALPSRREFASDLALLGATPLAALALTAHAQPAPEALAATATSLTEVVKSRHGKHLTEEQLQSVSQMIVRLLASAERMKRTPLRNSDEPGILFQADLP
jgi:hypothetical protein